MPHLSSTEVLVSVPEYTESVSDIVSAIDLATDLARCIAELTQL